MKMGPPPPPPTVEEAKQNLLAEELKLEPPSRLATDWARRHALPVAVAAGALGLLLIRSRVLRRVALAGLLAPALRKEVVRQVMAVATTIFSRR